MEQSNENVIVTSTEKEDSKLKLKLENAKLKRQNKQLQEENNQLKKFIGGK